VAFPSGHGFEEIRRKAGGLLHAKGPQDLLVATVTGLPILFRSRDREEPDLDELAAWAAELANLTFATASHLNSGELQRVELRFEKKSYLLMRDDPFVLLIRFPETAGKPLGAGRLDDLAELLQQLHEELN